LSFLSLASVVSAEDDEAIVAETMMYQLYISTNE
jgi:hypothetical protein